MKPALTRLGVGDSKGFASGEAGRAARRVLAGHVHQLAEVVVVRVFHAEEVDEAMEEKGGLDELERTAAKNIIEEVQKAGPVPQIVADGQALFEPLAECHRNFTAEDRADAKYVAVEAASIVAKSHRDALFARISGRYKDQFGDDNGDLKGNGYANEGTEAFLRRYHAETGELPPETRQSWKWAVVQELAGLASDEG